MKDSIDIDTNLIWFVKDDKISVHHPDQIHSQNLNNWKDYWCSTGIRSLYIHYDGIIYRGVCKAGGALGSVYDKGFHVHETYHWIQCTKNICSCGSDMQTPKVKDFSNTNLVTLNSMTSVDTCTLNKTDLVSYPDIVFCDAMKNYKLIIWELGRRCNFDCWYCFPDSHNNYEGHKTLGSLKHGFENLNRYWIAGQRVKFVFGGGEPTFNPNYLEFVTWLKTTYDHIIHTTTNGTHNATYYGKLMKVSDIIFSAHLAELERTDMFEKFIHNIKAAAEVQKSDPIAKYHWLGVRIMLQPGKLDIAQQVYHAVKEIVSNVTVDLIHSNQENSTKLKIIAYSNEELDWLKQTQL